MTKLLLRPNEAAEILGIGRSKTYQLISDGTLPSIRIGRKAVRVPLEALRRWIDEQVSGASDQAQRALGRPAGKPS